MARVGTVLTVPILYRIQFSLAIAMAAMMGMLLSEESLSTISSAWVWIVVSIIIGEYDHVIDEEMNADGMASKNQ